GPNTASNVVVSDTLPTGSTFVTATGPYSVTNGLVTWQPITTFSTSFSNNYDITITAPASGPITNVASALSDMFDPVATNNNGAGNNSIAVTTISNRADVLVYKTGPTVILAGGLITYDLRITNAGPSDAANVLVKDILPTG